MRDRHPAALFLALAMSFIMGTFGPAAGQVRHLEYVRLYGRVQWIGAEKMTVVKDCTLLESCAAVSVTFDLKQVALSEYRGVRAGSWVLVEGIVSHEDGRHRVMATSVMLVEEWQAP